MNSHRYLPIQTTCTYHTVLDLAGVRYRGMDPGRSLIDSTFVPMRPRMMLNPDGNARIRDGTGSLQQLSALSVSSQIRVVCAHAEDSPLILPPCSKEIEQGMKLEALEICQKVTALQHDLPGRRAVSRE